MNLCFNYLLTYQTTTLHVTVSHILFANKLYVSTSKLYEIQVFRSVSIKARLLPIDSALTSGTVRSKHLNVATEFALRSGVLDIAAARSVAVITIVALLNSYAQATDKYTRVTEIGT